ncbi:hypothetical protein NUACC21_48870 [Scytonema sp. NUACC21]
MTKQTNYYNDLSADYSKSGLVSHELAVRLLINGETYISLIEEILPKINSEYTLAQIEQENKQWWPTHCEALRQGRGDILAGEYANSFVYFCADGPFYGKVAAIDREIHWWAILAQPNVTMVWPLVLFNGEAVYSEWHCMDDVTKEVIAKGNQTFLRRGHRGACYLKCEQLNFYRDIYASNELLHWIRR